MHDWPDLPLVVADMGSGFGCCYGGRRVGRIYQVASDLAAGGGGVRSVQEGTAAHLAVVAPESEGYAYAVTP